MVRETAAQRRPGPSEIARHVLVATLRPQPLSAIWWLGVVGLVAVWGWLLMYQPELSGKPFGADAIAYHSAPMEAPYGGPQIGLSGAYLYPPPFLQALAPLRLLAWDAFISLWIALELIALAWLLGPAVALLTLALPFVLTEVAIGNIHVFMAVALVLAVRSTPGSWAFVALTKPTVAIVALWHPARGEWRAVAVAVLTTSTILLASVLLGSDLWSAWIQRMQNDAGTAGAGWLAFLAGRMLCAAAIVVFAAARNRAAFVPLAAFVALPIPWAEGLTLLAAIPRLARE